MSLEQKLKMFCGQFHALGDLPDTTDPAKEPYYPSAGTQITLNKVQRFGRWVIQMESSDPSINSALSTASFFLIGERLVSTPIEIQPGLSMTEVVEWNATADKMNHYLLWSDGELGNWKCTP